LTDDAPTPAQADTVTAAPEQTAAPAFDGPDWLKDLPDDVRLDKSLHKYTSWESAARGLSNAQRLIGMEKVPRPKGDFDPSNPDWQMFLDAAGRPKSADEYRFEPATLPDGLQYDSGLEDKFKGVFHTAGLNPKQAQLMRDAFVAHQAEAYQAAMTEIANDTNSRREALKREMGSAYEGLSKAAEVAQKEFVTDTLLEKINAAGLANDPEWTRVLGKIGKAMIGEEKLKAAGAQQENTPADWREKADLYRSQYNDALFNNQHPEHKIRTDEYTRIMQRAFPS